ncbi:hypothetical protein Tco_1544028, partial [Tanacetum coccineum]
MINMCLTSKTARYDRLRHPVLQIMKNLTTASHGKKKSSHLLILSVRKYEIFSMPIPNALLTDDIKGAPYYDEYLEHVAKYQQHLDAEHGMEDEGGATESPKATKVTKPKGAKGNGKEKVSDEQAAHNLLILQPLKKKSPADQFIFQRRTPMTTEPSGHAESPSLDAEQTLTDSETESDEEVHVINAGVQDEGHAGQNPGEQDEGHTGPNPGKLDEARLDQTLITDASKQQNPKKMDEEFTITAYPNVQENLKLPTEDQVVLEEPASS